jgi:transposase
MTNYTGCDAHKRICHFQQMDEDGALGLSIRVPTEKERITAFLDQFEEKTIMTLEAGRNWWWLCQLFKEHHNISAVKVTDPRRSKHLAQELSVRCGYGRARNDRIDSEMLAEQTRRGLAPLIHIPTQEQFEKRSINRRRFILVSIRTQFKNSIHAVSAMHGVDINISKLITDQETAKLIYTSLPEYATLMIKQYIDQIQLLDQQIALSEKILDKLLPPTDPVMNVLLSHPGIGPVGSRTIITETLDIHYFKEPKYYVSYSGLAPVKQESDGRNKALVKLNSFSNHFLKYAFIEAAHTCRSHDKFRRKYELDVKKRGKKIAKINLARKIAKTVYWMLTRQEPFKY